MASIDKPNVIDVSRFNDRVFVRVNNELVSVREEATGSIVWHHMAGFTEADKDVIRREVWDKIPWVPPVAPTNRAQRRRVAHFKKKVE